MGFAVAGLYIGVKYGPQIVHNLQAAKPPAAQAQTPPSQTTPADQTTGGMPNVTYPPGAVAPPLSLHDQGINVQPPNAGAIHPSHPNDTGTYPAHKQMIEHPAVRKPPVPSGTVKEAPSTHHRRKTVLPEHHTGPCPDGSYPDANNDCKPIPTYLQTGYKSITGPIRNPIFPPQTNFAPYDYESNIGYFNGYETAVPGPQWRRSIPYRQVIASQGMMKQGRVKRALAAGNHQFIPAGFTLSESSVRRGYDNVYSAGT